MISTLNRDQQCLMWSSFFSVGMLTVLSDGGQFRTSLECSTLLVLFPLSLLTILSCLSLTGVLGFTYFPNGILLISYSSFKSYCVAAVSASSVMSWTNCFLSFLALFFNLFVGFAIFFFNSSFCWASLFVDFLHLEYIITEYII